MKRQTYMALHFLLVAVAVLLILLNLAFFSVTMGHLDAHSLYSERENYRTVAVTLTAVKDYGDALLLEGSGENTNSDIWICIGGERYGILKERGACDRMLVGEEVLLGVADGTVMTSFIQQCASLTHRGETYLTYEQGIADLASAHREGAIRMGIVTAVLSVALTADCVGAALLLRQYLKKGKEEASQEYTPLFDGKGA